MQIWTSEHDQKISKMLAEHLKSGKSYGEAFITIANDLNMKPSAVKKRWYDNLRHKQKQEINDAIKTKAIHQKIDRLRKKRREHVSHISKIDQTIEQLKKEIKNLS